MAQFDEIFVSLQLNAASNEAPFREPPPQPSSAAATPKTSPNAPLIVTTSGGGGEAKAPFGVARSPLFSPVASAAVAATSIAQPPIAVTSASLLAKMTSSSSSTAAAATTIGSLTTSLHPRLPTLQPSSALATAAATARYLRRASSCGPRIDAATAGGGGGDATPLLSDSSNEAESDGDASYDTILSLNDENAAARLAYTSGSSQTETHMQRRLRLRRQFSTRYASSESLPSMLTLADASRRVFVVVVVCQRGGRR